MECEETQYETPHCPQIRIDENLAKNQTKLNCNGVQIYFPFPPYPAQVEYMTSVVKACESAQNALIESPTGTGKTLSLLCSTLGWLKEKRKTCPEMNYPRIIYTSRTHAQLAQAVRELKKTVYRPTMCVLASREHLCINPEAKKYSDSQINLTCMRLKKTGQCPYGKGTKEKFENLRNQILDLEELAEYCKKIKWCPFFAAREMITMSDLLFLPYNYVLDITYHNMFKELQFANTILVFDEAHNVQKVAEDAWMFDLSVGWLEKCLTEISEVKYVKNSIMKGDPKYDNLAPEAKNISPEELAYVEYPIKNLISYLKRIKDVGKDGLTFEGKMILDFFMKGTGYRETGDEIKDSTGYENPNTGGLNLGNSDVYMKLLGFCTELAATQNRGEFLTLMFQTFTMIFQFIATQKQTKFTSPFSHSYPAIAYTIDDFKLLLHDDVEEPLDEKKKAKKAKGEYRSLKAFCFNPGLSFIVLETKKPRSIILTSGTLCPMDALEKDLKINFEIKLVQGHIINDDQVLLQIVTRDHSKSLFNFNYANRDNAKQLKSLGNLISEICAVTPGGVLVFFCSYVMLNKCFNSWKENIIQEIQARGRKIFIEDADAKKNMQKVREYKETIAEYAEGAVFFAVCRGKIGEGLDFAGKEARSAVVIGIPFPPANSRQVMLKRDYLDERNEQLKINGITWYRQEAMKAVNQCLGRCIRAKNDFASLVLIDHRYSSNWLKDRLSKWFSKNGKTIEDSDIAIKNIHNFFTIMSKKMSIENRKPKTAKKVIPENPIILNPEPNPANSKKIVTKIQTSRFDSEDLEENSYDKPHLKEPEFQHTNEQYDIFEENSQKSNEEPVKPTIKFEKASKLISDENSKIREEFNKEIQDKPKSVKMLNKEKSILLKSNISELKEKYPNAKILQFEITVNKEENNEFKEKIKDCEDLLLMALGEPLFSEIMEAFKNYHEKRIKNIQLLAEFAYDCFSEAMKKCSECKKSYIKLGMKKTLELIRPEDRENYEKKLSSLVSQNV